MPMGCGLWTARPSCPPLTAVRTTSGMRALGRLEQWPSYRQEESGTDVASELTTMIQTQRAYSSNAKVIQTVDEMLQETTNIKR